jgi:hypothetical protein
MSAWNSGPFDNDAAADLLGELAGMSETERPDRLMDLFAGAVQSPDGAQTYPSEVVAGAALVAITLPGGDQVLRFQKVDMSEELALAMIAASPDGLARLALQALREVTRPDRFWNKSWLDDMDRSEANEAAEAIASVLMAFIG